MQGGVIDEDGMFGTHRIEQIPCEIVRSLLQRWVELPAHHPFPGRGCPSIFAKLCQRRCRGVEAVGSDVGKLVHHGQRRQVHMGFDKARYHYLALKIQSRHPLCSGWGVLETTDPSDTSFLDQNALSDRCCGIHGDDMRSGYQHRRRSKAIWSGGGALSLGRQIDIRQPQGFSKNVCATGAGEWVCTVMFRHRML